MAFDWRLTGVEWALKSAFENFWCVFVSYCLSFRYKDVWR